MMIFIKYESDWMNMKRARGTYIRESTLYQILYKLTIVPDKKMAKTGRPNCFQTPADPHMMRRQSDDDNLKV